MKFGPKVEKAKQFNKDTEYKIDLVCQNCRRVQEVVIPKGVSVKGTVEQGKECSYCGCKFSFDKEGKIPYSFW